METGWLFLAIIILLFCCLITWLIAYNFSRKKFSTLATRQAAQDVEKFSGIQQMLEQQITEQKQAVSELKQQLLQKEEKQNLLARENATSNAEKNHFSELLQLARNEAQSIREELMQQKNREQGLLEKIQEQAANNRVLEEKMTFQKKELEALHGKLNATFENLANRIFRQRTEDLSELNQERLKPLLEPLSKNLSEFKAKVEEVYIKEAKERFSLSERVKELAELNRKISAEAHQLTTALKGEAKTQGRWGEMILESILEKSGLTKGREYFMEYQLEDKDGKALLSSASGKKMRPDAVVKYPGNRSIIIDSKVSLNAYTRYVAASDEHAREAELSAHVAAIQNHIRTLSEKGYDDYGESLDFVMLFIPSESAYMAAIQKDANLWNFAYDKRILLLSPANLITALKLVVDLWKREYQDLNARQIAEQGGRLYDKFVGFIGNLTAVGQSLEKAQQQFDNAQKQLFDGKNNLVRQAEKLKELGVKSKKTLPGIQQNPE